MYKGMTPNPDRGFVNKLKKIDPTLDCSFNRAHGKFVITQLGKISGRVNVAIVEGNEGGGYRYPDNRDIRMLQRSDLHRSGQEVKDRVRDGEERMINAKIEQQRKVKEEIRDTTKDDKLQLASAYHEAFNLPGKGPSKSAFRRIEREPKGFTVHDKRKLSN